MIRQLQKSIPVVLLASMAFGAHSGTDLFVPVAGSTTGLGGAEYRTTLWITNVSPDRADIRLEFLRSREPNPSPSALAETFSIDPGRTVVIQDVSQLLRIAALGALRINSSVPVVATARVFSGRRGESDAATLAMSYAAIPAEFAIGRGQTTVLQGVRQDAEFRYNLSMVETAGRRIAMELELRDHDDRLLGKRSVALLEHEQRTFSMESLFPGVVTSGAILVVKPVTGGGKVLLVGSQVAAMSNDATAFEMYAGSVSRRKLPPADLAIYGVGVLLVVLIGIVATRRR